jgi:endonuclease YncB( thermonuclease family)
MLLLLVVISALELYEQGRITWHQTVIAEIGESTHQLLRDLTGIQRSETPAPVPASGQKLTGTVVKVTDGDTFGLLTPDRHEYTIRLYGIDAPEYDQPYGRAASRALTGMIDDRAVSVTIEAVDKYGRLVGQVYHQQQNLNLAMVRGGHAWWYKQYAKSNVALGQAEAEARAKAAGLWAESNPVPPWTWRYRSRN